MTGFNPWPPRLVGLGLIAAFTVSVLGPLFVIHPGFGAATPWVRIFGPDLLSARPVSVLGGVVNLHRGGDWGLALFLVGFSWVFPLAKLLACEWAIQDLAAGRSPGGFLSFVHAFGVLSLTECMVPAVLAVVLKALPGGTYLALGWAFWLFVGSAVGTIGLVAWLLRASKARPV